MQCGREIGIVISRHNRKPVDGDIVVCTACGAFMVWQGRGLEAVGNGELGVIKKTPFYQEILEELRKLG